MIFLLHIIIQISIIIIMLLGVFKKLDDWIQQENESAFKESAMQLSACSFRILGQAALLQSELTIELRYTADVDAYTDAEYSIIEQLNFLLKPHGMKYDQLSAEVWMPEGTVYLPFYAGKRITVEVAQAEYLLIAKAKLAKEKNKALLAEYVSKEASDLFFELAEKYKIDLSF